MTILKKLVENSVIPIFLLFTILTQSHIFSPTKTEVVDIGKIHKEQALSIIKRYEGFRKYPYKDNDGTLKIGYGFSADGRKEITEKEADEVLESKVNVIAKEIKEKAEAYNILLDTNHIYALTSLSYNIGNVDDMIANPHLINENEIMRYVYAKIDGKYTKLNGLVNRRKEEARLLNS